MFRRILFNPIYSRQFGKRPSSNGTNANETVMSLNDYHAASDKTLDELSEKLESILEERYDKGADVSLNNGVLTVVVDNQNTYVINKQTPNKQIWLSSPISGPKRFDYESGCWVEKYSRTELRKLLSNEISRLIDSQVEC